MVDDSDWCVFFYKTHSLLRRITYNLYRIDLLDCPSKFFCRIEMRSSNEYSSAKKMHSHITYAQQKNGFLYNVGH